MIFGGILSRIGPPPAVFLFLLAACPAPVAAQPPPQDPVAIGLMIAASGLVASLGEECRRGFLAAASYYSGDRVGPHKVRYVWGDHKGEGRSAVTEFTRMTEIEQSIAVATHHSQPSMQINPLSRRSLIPLLSVAGQAGFIDENPYAFRFWYSSRGEGKLLGEYLLRKGIKRLAIISVQDEYALSFKESVVAAFPKQNTHEFDVDPSTRDFQALAARIKGLNPDAVVVNVAISQAQAFMVQARLLALTDKLMAGNGWFGLAELEAQARSGLFDGIIYIKLAPPEIVVGRGDAAAPAAPILYACFTELMALLQALEHCAPPVTRDSLYRRLLDLYLVDVPPSPIPVQNREGRFPFRMGSYKAGKQTVLEPPQ